jgi:hypothetical protein
LNFISTYTINIIPGRPGSRFIEIFLQQPGCGNRIIFLCPPFLLSPGYLHQTAGPGSRQTFIPVFDGYGNTLSQFRDEEPDFFTLMADGPIHQVRHSNDYRAHIMNINQIFYLTDCPVIVPAFYYVKRTGDTPLRITDGQPYAPVADIHSQNSRNGTSFYPFCLTI